jgi:hypothetical protein
MTVTSHIDANDTNGDLGQRIRENLESQGFKKVRVSSNPEDGCLSVEGRIGDRGKMTIRVDRKDDRREVILIDVYRRSKLIWSRLDVYDFPDIIAFAKSLISPPLESVSLLESTPKSVTKDTAEPIAASTPEAFYSMEPVSPELASVVESNDVQKPQPTKSDRLGTNATIALSLLATMTLGAFLYLVWEVRSSHQQIQELKEQLQNQR